MRVLIACEFSGIVRDAFAAKGHEAWSCDLLSSEQEGNHYQCDVINVLRFDWDLLIAHPPCTYLAASGARWWTGKRSQQEEAAKFAITLSLWSSIQKTVVENPIGHLSTRFRKPDQIIQPWQFGHGETKATCLWLRGLPLLKATQVVTGRDAKVHRMTPSLDRWRNRSRTYQGIANAMAEQWG